MVKFYRFGFEVKFYCFGFVVKFHPLRAWVKFYRPAAARLRFEVKFRLLEPEFCYPAMKFCCRGLKFYYLAAKAHRPLVKFYRSARNRRYFAPNLHRAERPQGSPRNLTQ